MAIVRVPEHVTIIVNDVLVNRRRGRFELAATSGALLLAQGDDVQRIEVDSISAVAFAVTDQRARLRFRTDDGSAWTLRWFDGPSARTGLLLDLLPAGDQAPSAQRLDETA